MKHLIISYDEETGTVLVDTRGLSPFEVSGILFAAKELADDDLPSVAFLEPEGEEIAEPGDDDMEDEDE